MLNEDEDAALRRQAQVFDASLQTMEQRTETYGLVWQQYGALANLLNAARKVDRLMSIWWHGDAEDVPAIHKDALDDAVDAINYLGFFVQCAKDGNLLGLPPTRPDLKVLRGKD